MAGEFGVIQEQGFIMGNGLGFTPINENKKPEENKKDEKKDK